MPDLAWTGQIGLTCSATAKLSGRMSVMATREAANALAATAAFRPAPRVDFTIQGLCFAHLSCCDLQSAASTKLDILRQDRRWHLGV